jgi:hypothetical protein
MRLRWSSELFTAQHSIRLTPSGHRAILDGRDAGGFSFQHSSVDCEQLGRSFPYEIVSSRPGFTPIVTRNVVTAEARRAPNARLYSRVPRSSACPSTISVADGYLSNQATCLRSVS